MSGIQTAGSQSLRLCSNDGARILHTKQHRKPTQAAAATGTAESHDTGLRLRFNSLTLDELSEELDRRTKETQRLQEEVEHATKEALEKFCTYRINSSPGQSCHSLNDPPGAFAILPSQCQTEAAPLVGGVDHLNQEVVHRQIAPPEKAVDDCLQRLSDLSLSKTQDQHEREKFTFDKAITDLQTKLHNLHDLRVKDSRKHVDQMEKMLCMLEELQNIKRAADQKQQETEDEALALNRKVETLEQILKETYSALLLSHEKQHGNGSMMSPKVFTGSRQLSTAANLNEDFNNVPEKLRERLFVQSIEHITNEDHRGINEQQLRLEDLIESLGQEMALLTDKLNSSKYNGVSLSVKLEMLKKLVAGQATLHQCQVSELEAILYSYKDKVCFVEQQLLQAQSQLVEAQRERERSSQQAEEIQSQLGQLKRCGEQQQCELQVEVRALRGRLEEAREEKNDLQSLLDQEGRKSQELLRDKDKELWLRQQEAQQHLSWLQEAESRCQTLHIEGETLKLKLDDQDKLMSMLRLQMESSAQMHSRTIDNLHQENSLLSNQLNQHKLENQQLRVELDKSKSDLATADRDRQLLQASVAEQRQRVEEETLEKQHLSAQLEIQRLQLLTLTKEHKELQRLHSCRNEEREGVVLRLQSQLRNAHDELDQARSTLKTLEGADGHGLQVAMDMQTEITARREQVDSLQGKIQHLEETVERLHQEKRYQSLESQRQLQELTFVKEEKKQLANELQTLRSKDHQLRERIGQLESILHKMTESFADCQEFIQLREQDFYRLKLRHALDLKELQGQNVRTAVNVPPPHLDPLTPSAVITPPSSQQAFNTQIKSKRQQESPARELRSLVRELRGVISENHRPHTDNSAAGSCFHRRRSAPERRALRTTFSTDKAEEIKSVSRTRRKTCKSEPHILTTAELDGKIINSGKSFCESCAVSSPLAAVRYTSSPKLLSPGRRSPVHSLLTSDPSG